MDKIGKGKPILTVLYQSIYFAVKEAELLYGMTFFYTTYLQNENPVIQFANAQISASLQHRWTTHGWRPLQEGPARSEFGFFGAHPSN